MAQAKRKLIDFRDLKDAIVEYANEHHEGNFNRAVRELLRSKLVQEGYQNE